MDKYGVECECPGDQPLIGKTAEDGSKIDRECPKCGRKWTMLALEDSLVIEDNDKKGGSDSVES